MGKKFEFFTGFNVYPRPKDIYMCESRLSLNIVMVPAVFCENLFKLRCDWVISGNKLNGKISFFFLYKFSTYKMTFF